jgi:hypothetical protein
LEFPQGFLKSHSASVHLQYKAFELPFTTTSSLLHKLHALSRSKESAGTQSLDRERRTPKKNTKMEKAVILVTL